jgi:hypothetical protein
MEPRRCRPIHGEESLVTRPLMLIALAGLACAGPTEPGPVGTWAGRDAVMVLADSGGSVTYGCGFSTIDRGWRISSDGSFTANGMFFPGGGPLPPQGHPPHPARYLGALRDGSFQFTLTLTDLEQTLGPFALRRGPPTPIDQCL